MLLLVCTNDYLLNRIKVVLVRIMMIYPIFHIKFTMVKKGKTNNNKHIFPDFFSHSTQHLIPGDSKEKECKERVYSPRTMVTG